MNNEERIIELLTDIKALLGEIKNSPYPKDITSRPFQSKTVKKKADERFDEFYSIYPKKVDGKGARKRWMTRGLDKIADILIADVKNRTENDAQWLSGYIPNPATYLNNDRWEDDIQTAVQPVIKANPADYIIPQDWKENGFKVGIQPYENEKYVDFRARVEMALDRITI